MKEVKEEILEWIEYIKNTKDVDKAIGKLEELFKEKYTYEYESDCEDEYYEYIKERYILNDEIEVDVVSGDWDRFGEFVSHKGYDIFLCSNINDCEEKLCIFATSEYNNEIDNIDIDFFFKNHDFKKENEEELEEKFE